MVLYTFWRGEGKRRTSELGIWGLWGLGVMLDQDLGMMRRLVSDGLCRRSWSLYLILVRV